MTLINQIQGNGKIMEFEHAVDVSVMYCIKHNVLKTFLLRHRAEVKDVCLTEYEEKNFVNGIRAEGRKKGRKEGREEERLSAIRDMIEFGLPKDLILKKYSEYEYAKASQKLMNV